MDSIVTGLASYGMSGQVFHGPLLKADRDFEVTAILERSKNLSRDAFPDAKIVRTFDELIAEKDIELIVVNTPDHTHHQLAKKALLAGKHVVVEKPITLRSDHAGELIGIAEKKKVFLTVFQNRRWDGDFMTVKSICEQGLLGRLTDYEAHFDRFRNYIQPDTWKEDQATGTGTLYNLGSHLIDQALVLFGMPLSVYADIRKSRDSSSVDDNFVLLLDYGEMRATIRASYLVREPGPRYLLHGTEGSFLKWGVDPQEEMLKKGQLPVSDNWGEEPESEWGLLHTQLKGTLYRGKIRTIPGDYRCFYRNVRNVLRDGESPEVKAKEGMNVIRIIEAAKQSQESGKPVSP